MHYPDPIGESVLCASLPQNAKKTVSVPIHWDWELELDTAQYDPLSGQTSRV